jgi:hypothetical protein
MVADGGVAAVGERAGAPVAYASGVVGIPAEHPRRDPAQTNTKSSHHITADQFIN